MNVQVTCLVEAVNTLDKFGLVLLVLSISVNVLVTCVVEAVNINNKLGLAL